jgi:hypothetical protein
MHKQILKQPEIQPAGKYDNDGHGFGLRFWALY